MHDWRESARLFAYLAAQLTDELQEQKALIDSLREEVFRLTRELADARLTRDDLLRRLNRDRNQ